MLKTRLLIQPILISMNLGMSGMDAPAPSSTGQFSPPKNEFFQGREMPGEQSALVPNVLSAPSHPFPSDKSGQGNNLQSVNPQTKTGQAVSERTEKRERIPDVAEPSPFDHDTLPHQDFYNHRPQKSAGDTPKESVDSSALSTGNADAQTERGSGAVILPIPNPIGNTDYSNNFDNDGKSLADTESPDVYQHKQKQGESSNIPTVSKNLAEPKQERQTARGDAAVKQDFLLGESNKTPGTGSLLPDPEQRASNTLDGFSGIGSGLMDTQPDQEGNPVRHDAARPTKQGMPSNSEIDKAKPGSYLDVPNDNTVNTFSPNHDLSIEPEQDGKLTKGHPEIPPAVNLAGFGRNTDFQLNSERHLDDSTFIDTDDKHGEDIAPKDHLRRPTDPVTSDVSGISGPGRFSQTNPTHHDANFEPAISFPTNAKQPSSSPPGRVNSNLENSNPFSGSMTKATEPVAMYQHTAYQNSGHVLPTAQWNDHSGGSRTSPPDPVLNSDQGGTVAEVVPKAPPADFSNLIRNNFDHPSDGRSETPSSRRQPTLNGASIINSAPSASPLKEVYSDKHGKPKFLPDGNNVVNHNQAGRTADFYDDIPAIDSHNHRVTTNQVNKVDPDGTDNVLNMEGKYSSPVPEHSRPRPGAMVPLPLSIENSEDSGKQKMIPYQHKQRLKPSHSAGDGRGLNGRIPDNSKFIPPEATAPVSTFVQEPNQRESLTADNFKNRSMHPKDKIALIPEDGEHRNESPGIGNDQALSKPESHPAAAISTMPWPVSESQQNPTKDSSYKESLDAFRDLQPGNDEVHEAGKRPPAIQSARFTPTASKFDSEWFSGNRPGQLPFASQWRSDHPYEKRGPPDSVDNYRHNIMPPRELNNIRHQKHAEQFSELHAANLRRESQHLPKMQQKAERTTSENEPQESPLLQKEANEKQLIGNPANEPVSWSAGQTVHAENSGNIHDPHPKTHALETSENGNYVVNPKTADFYDGIPVMDSYHHRVTTDHVNKPEPDRTADVLNMEGDYSSAAPEDSRPSSGAIVILPFSIENSEDSDEQKTIPFQHNQRGKPISNAGDGGPNGRMNDNSEFTPPGTVAPISTVVQGPNQQETLTADTFKHRPMTHPEDKTNQIPKDGEYINKSPATGNDQPMWKPESHPTAADNAMSRPLSESQKNPARDHGYKEYLDESRDLQSENDEVHESAERPPAIQRARFKLPFASQGRTDHPYEKRDPPDSADNYRHMPPRELNDKGHHKHAEQFSESPAGDPRDASQHLRKMQKAERTQPANKPQESPLQPQETNEEQFIGTPSNEPVSRSYWLPSHAVPAENSGNITDSYRHEPHQKAYALETPETADTFSELLAGYSQQASGPPTDEGLFVPAQPPAHHKDTGPETMSIPEHPNHQGESSGMSAYHHKVPHENTAKSKLDSEDNLEGSFENASHRTNNHPHLLAAAVPLHAAASNENPEDNDPYFNQKTEFPREGGRFPLSDSSAHHMGNTTNFRKSAQPVPYAGRSSEDAITENNRRNMAAFRANSGNAREQFESSRNRARTDGNAEVTDSDINESFYSQPGAAEFDNEEFRQMDRPLEGQNLSDTPGASHPYRQRFNDEIMLVQHRPLDPTAPAQQTPAKNTLTSHNMAPGNGDPTSHNKQRFRAGAIEEVEDPAATDKSYQRKPPADGFGSHPAEQPEYSSMDGSRKSSSPRSPDNSSVALPMGLAVASSQKDIRPVLDESRARRSRSTPIPYQQHKSRTVAPKEPYGVETQPEDSSPTPVPMQRNITWKSTLPAMAMISSTFVTDSYANITSATTLPDWTEMTTKSGQSSMQCSMSHSSTVGTSMIGYNLLVSFVLFLIGIVIFYFATKGVQRQERKQLLERRMSTGSDWIKTFYSQKIMDEKPPAPASTRTSSESASDVVTDVDLGFFLPLFWFWKTEEIERRCGKSATQYLRFTEYLIAYASFVVIIATLIVLPLNLNGPLIKTKLEFGRTTMSNVDPQSNVLWVHVVFSILLFPIALLFATKFVRTFRGYSKPDRSSRTLMITNLSTKSASEDKIRKHFEEGHPDAEISRINLSYRTNKLHRLDKELQLCTSCLKYYEKTLRPGSEPPVYSRDNLCTRCCCCCCDVGIDAVQYYTNRAAELEIRIEQLIDQPRLPNSTFFVTFEEEEAATKVCKQYRNPIIAVRTPQTEFSKEMKAKSWSAQFAPFPDLIKWQNLETGGLHWWLRAILLNVGLFLFLFFITSPIIILNALGVTQWAKNLVILNQVIPGILMVELGFVIGALMKFVTMQTRYHDKIRELMVALKGTFSYTLIAQLLLPTFGLTSAKALYDYLKESSSSGHFNWECLFLPDYGMVFVTFLIFQSLFGSSLVFSRILELQMMVFKRCNARSSAERWLISQRKQPFTFTAGYSRNLVFFAIIVVFAFVVPYVAPVGLFALMMTHIAERYSIFFVNRRSEVPNPIHRSAVNLFLFCVLLQLIMMLFFTAIRIGNVGTGAMLIAGVIYTIILIYISWREEFGKFQKVHSTAIGNKFLMHIDEDDDEGSVDPMAESQAYEAPILRRYELLRPLTSKHHSSWRDSRESPPSNSQPE